MDFILFNAWLTGYPTFLIIIQDTVDMLGQQLHYDSYRFFMRKQLLNLACGVEFRFRIPIRDYFKGLQTNKLPKYLDLPLAPQMCWFYAPACGWKCIEMLNKPWMEIDPWLQILTCKNKSKEKNENENAIIHTVSVGEGVDMWVCSIPSFNALTSFLYQFAQP